MSGVRETANRRTPVERVLDEFGFGDGLINATPEDVERMAAEVVHLRNAAEQAEMGAMRRKYLDYGHGPQAPENGSQDPHQ